MPASISVRKSVFAVCCLVFLFFVALFPLQGANPVQKNYAEFDRLIGKAALEGGVRVIIKLNVPHIEELTTAANRFCSPAPGEEPEWAGGPATMALKDAITDVAQLVMAQMSGKEYEVNHMYRSVPFLALLVSAEALAVLRDSSAVLSVAEDMPRKLIEPVEKSASSEGSGPVASPADADPPLLNNTVNIIGASAAWAMGYTGSGWYVAILDTGIRKTHQFFTGKTVVEACYALGSDGSGPAGDCPNGLTSMTGSGAAVHYSSTYQGYDHGTHVSGIAAGNYGSLYGVAKDANIIAVKVFSMFSASDCGSANPCVMSWDSDQVAGLDYVYSIRGSYSISSANMSLGGGSYNAACDSESQKVAIDNLRSAGIATAIATGNNSYCSSISSPACISTSVSVGSTTDADVRSSFSNWHPTLQKLFAPGSAVYSSTGASDSSYGSWSGTSMATPHVTGAWALVKQALSTVTVTDALAALRATGVPITTSCDSYTVAIPRIQVDDAITSLLPASITVTAPNGGESWQAGTTHDILWTSSGAIANVKIELSFDGGGLYSTIIASTPNDGSYSWTSGTTPSLNCIMRISDAADSTSDTSDAAFVLTSPPSLTGNSFTYPASWTMETFGTDGWYVGDFDGDTRSDILRYVEGVSGGDVFLSSGSAFVANGSWTSADHGADGWYIGDFNGDGHSDLMRYVPGVSGADVFLSNGSAFVSSGSWMRGGNGEDGWYIGDFNGDGRDDVMRYMAKGTATQVFLSNGTKFLSAGTWTTDSNGSDGWYVGDYNGDGRDDIMRYVPGVSGGEVYLSSGTAFVAAGSWTGAGNGGKGWYIGDFNGDTYSDIMRYVLLLSGADIFLSSGSAFGYDGSWTPAGKGTDDWYLGDFNGDGRTDLMRYITGVTGGDVLLSTSGGGGSSSSGPASIQSRLNKNRWLNDVPLKDWPSARDTASRLGQKPGVRRLENWCAR